MHLSSKAAERLGHRPAKCRQLSLLWAVVLQSKAAQSRVGVLHALHDHKTATRGMIGSQEACACSKIA